jgi:NAD(P)-dependent dehydrogenase (short-subunit alcohol dehydrogenase family)
VAVLDRRAQAARAVAAEAGGVALEVDVTDCDAVHRAVDEAARSLGGLDAVINNAGVGWMAPLLDTPAEKWERVVAVNLGGAFHGVQAGARAMRRAGGGGAIVNVASISAIRPSAGDAPYAASKAGIVALTASAALELAPEIRVNAVSPGPVDTPLLRSYFERFPTERERYADATPLARMAEPGDVVGVILFLCSDLARFVTGQNIVVDGGITLHGSSADGMLEKVTSAPAKPSLAPRYGD